MLIILSSVVQHYLMPELLQYIFYWIAIFAFITFAYRHAFYSRLLILKIFPEQVMFWPFRMPEYQMLFAVTMNLACPMFITIMIISLQKTIKNYCHRTDLKNKNGSLRLHGGFFLCFCVLKEYTKTYVINLNVNILLRYLGISPPEPYSVYVFSGEPEMSMDSSTSMKNKINSMTL